MLPSLSRRRFMTQAAGAGLFLSSTPASLDAFAAALAADPVAGESSWLRVREQFPFHEFTVPMHAANLCPSPVVVAQRVGSLRWH